MYRGERALTSNPRRVHQNDFRVGVRFHSDRVDIRQRSAVAFEQNAQSGQSARLRDIIHRAVLRSPSPLTRSEIAERTGLPINTVAGRVNELMKAGMLAELPPVRCPESGRMAHPLLVDMAIHHVDLLRAITGREVASVDARRSGDRPARCSASET